MLKIEVRTPFYSGVEDFTFFLNARDLKDAFCEPLPASLALKNQWDETVSLKPIGAGHSLIGRLNVSSSFCQDWLSCSFRATGDTSGGSREYNSSAYLIDSSRYNPALPPKRDDRYVKHVSGERFLNSMGVLCDVIFRRIFGLTSGAHGLVIVSGATATGKSQVARGLIYKYLSQLVPSEKSVTRRPHLVTFEDPIDKRWADDPESAQTTGIDYTPREWKKDVDSLKDAIDAALRQTPKVFFVGETRNPDDWKEMFRFASTGHLAVTTSHAGSLTEAMGQLFRASDANTPARRSQVANLILALVHLRSEKVSHRSVGSEELNITLPAIWVRSPVATKSLMADGLTALLPYRDLGSGDDTPGRAGDLGCLGRSWFAEQLLSRTDKDNNMNFGREIRHKSLTWDLEGL